MYIYIYIYKVVDWDPKSKRKGAPQAHETTHAKAVCLSQCGNYGVVGYSCGRIDKYNMQVGLRPPMSLLLGARAHARVAARVRPHCVAAF